MLKPSDEARNNGKYWGVSEDYEKEKEAPRDVFLRDEARTTAETSRLLGILDCFTPEEVEEERVETISPEVYPIKGMC